MGGLTRPSLRLHDHFHDAPHRRSGFVQIDSFAGQVIETVVPGGAPGTQGKRLGPQGQNRVQMVKLDIEELQRGTALDRELYLTIHSASNIGVVANRLADAYTRDARRFVWKTCPPQ